MPRTAFINLLDSFTPAAIREKQHLTSQELIHTRAMLAILGFSIITPLVLLVVYVAIQFLTGNDFSRNIYILMVVEIFLVSQHIYFQSYGNLRVTAGAYSLQFLIVIVVFSAISGGLHSPLIILLVCSPMIAYMTMGLAAGLAHIAAVFLVLVGLLVMHIKGLDYLNVSHKENYPYTLTIASAVTLLVMAMFLMVFEELVRNKK